MMAEPAIQIKNEGRVVLMKIQDEKGSWVNLRMKPEGACKLASDLIAVAGAAGRN